MEELAKDELINNTISPFKEMLSYETLWSIDGMTEAKLGNLFKQFDDLPSTVLEKYCCQTNLLEDPISELQEKVLNFLEPKLNKFSIVVNRDFQYPIELRDAKYPTELFYYKGNLDILKTPCVSVVGARQASEDGRTRAKRLAKELCQEGYTVVSGLAAGIDTAAHTGAIENNGQTIGVIGTPIDSYYPKENRNLQDSIAKDFLLISQVPFYRYENEPFKNRRLHFPRRNVTMASISNATVIVEASDTSGSLTQAKACMNQNRKLFILDSCFENSSIQWPKLYEEQGAVRVKKTSDILNALKSL